MSKETTMSELPSQSATGPREKMIQTAVSFLSNPRVMQSEISHKTYFLKRKGLTDDEIDIAMKRSITMNNQHSSMTTISSHQSSFGPWSKISTFSSSAVVVGTSVYLLHKLYKRFILPYFFGIPTENDKISNLEKTIASLKDSIDNLNSLLVSVDKKMDSCCDNLSALKHSDSFKNQAGDLESLKGEISSVKGLLLNRKQFPLAPISIPTIPSWQQEQVTLDAEKASPNARCQSEDVHDDAIKKDEKLDDAPNKSNDSNSSDNGSYVCVSDPSDH